MGTTAIFHLLAQVGLAIYVNFPEIDTFGLQQLLGPQTIWAPGSGINYYIYHYI
jgi:hypothetical protein